MRTDRFQILIEELRKPQHANRINLTNWATFNNGQEFGFDRWDVPPTLLNECGSTACAFGLACLIPQFRKQGLKFSGPRPQFQGHTGYEAAMKFFEITERESLKLFCADFYKKEEWSNPLAVADKIERFINEPI